MKYMYIGKYLSMEQISDLIRPEKEVVGEVFEWLSQYIPSEDIQLLPRGDWIKFQTTISTAEQILNCKFHVFKRGSSSFLFNSSLKHGVFI